MGEAQRSQYPDIYAFCLHLLRQLATFNNNNSCKLNVFPAFYNNLRLCTINAAAFTWNVGWGRTVTGRATIGKNVTKFEKNIFFICLKLD